MKQKRNWGDFFAERTNMQEEAFPTQSVVEIYGDGRMLIEHHCGVISYGAEQICIRMRYGTLQVNGCHLEVAKMTAHQMIITGQIHAVELIRRQ
jgi:sporulation protein YqfC